MEGIEPATFDEFLHFTLENMATCMTQGLKMLHHYLNAMGILSYNAIDKRQLWKRKNLEQPGRVKEIANMSFFPGAKSLLLSVGPISSSVNNCQVIIDDCP